MAVVASGNKIYAIGGYNSEGCSDVMEVYDIINNEWSRGESMSVARRGAAAVVFDGNIYVIGGKNDSGEYLSTVEKYNIDSGQWETISAQLKYPRAYLGAEVINGKIYALGGFNGKSHLSVVEVFDPEKPEKDG